VGEWTHMCAYLRHVCVFTACVRIYDMCAYVRICETKQKEEKATRKRQNKNRQKTVTKIRRGGEKYKQTWRYYSSLLLLFTTPLYYSSLLLLFTTPLYYSSLLLLFTCSPGKVQTNLEVLLLFTTPLYYSSLQQTWREPEKTYGRCGR